MDISLEQCDDVAFEVNLKTPDGTINVHCVIADIGGVRRDKDGNVNLIRSKETPGVQPYAVWQFECDADYTTLRVTFFSHKSSTRMKFEVDAAECKLLFHYFSEVIDM